MQPMLVSLGGTLSMLVLMAVLSKVVPPFALILVSAAWAAWDSSRLDLRRYQTGLAYPPIGLFLAIAFLWIFGFPWYLYVSQKIRRGELQPKRGQPLAARR